MQTIETKQNLINGQYKWRDRAIDDKGSTSEWQEFGETGNVDFEVKLMSDMKTSSTNS